MELTFFGKTENESQKHSLLLSSVKVLTENRAILVREKCGDLSHLRSPETFLMSWPLCRDLNGIRKHVHVLRK